MNATDLTVNAIKIKTEYEVHSSSDDGFSSPLKNSKLASLVNDMGTVGPVKVMIKTHGFKLPFI
jgi:hypothetical protein